MLESFAQQIKEKQLAINDPITSTHTHFLRIKSVKDMILFTSMILEFQAEFFFGISRFLFIYFSQCGFCLRQGGNETHIHRTLHAKIKRKSNRNQLSSLSIRHKILIVFFITFTGTLPPSSLNPALCPLATTKSNSLSILLKFCNQLIALSDYILVLLVLIVWSVGFNHTLARYTVNGAGNTACRDEARKITRRR